MRPEGCEHDLLRALASMPFLDRLEMVAVTGWSRGAVYDAVAKLESGGFCAAVPHATELLPPARRFHLTAAGLRRLAGEEDISLDELVRRRPLSAQWRRSLMERLDALASVYGVACAVSNVAYPLRFRWYRAMPLDAAMTLPDGKTVGVVRQGLTADRSGFSRRLWQLRDWPLPGTVLVLMADDVRLRHARRLLSTTDVPALFAVERDAVLAGAGDRIWTPARMGAETDLRRSLDRAAPGRGLPLEPEPQRADAPGDIAVEGPGWDIPDHMLPVMLKPVEKLRPRPDLRLALDRPQGVGRADERLAPEGVPGRHTHRRVRTRGTATGRGRTAGPHRPGAGGAGPQGPHLRGRRPKAVEHRPRGLRGSPGVAQPHRQENKAASQKRRAHRRSPRLPGRAHGAGPPPGVGGRTARPAQEGLPLLQARRRDALRQPRRLRHPAEGRHRLALLPGGGSAAPCGPPPCRSVSPPICATTLLTGPPTTTERGPPVLVVFDTEIAQTHFLRVAREEIDHARVNVPLWVSHREAVAALGPLGRAWRAPGDSNSPQALPPQ